MKITYLVIAATISLGLFAVGQNIFADNTSFAKINVIYNSTANTLDLTGIVYKTFSQNYALTIFNPQGRLITISQLQLSQDDTFSENIIPSSALWSESGNYTVKLASGPQMLSVKSFYFPGVPCCTKNSQGIQAISGTTNVIVSPLKQFKSGIAANDVKCNNGLSLVIKAEDGSPVCVKQQTAQKLVERAWGWAMQTVDSLKRLQPNKIPGLENDTGIATLQNQTYYFVTPNYTNTAYSKPIQVSFHDVVFTLFPPGFRGGLPTGVGCGSGTAGELVTGGGSYYWTDAKFSDGTHQLLHIYADSQPCPAQLPPIYLSNHTNPQAGLTFYDGKMKLLVSTNNQKLSFMNIKVFSSYTPSSLVDHFLTGNLYSTRGPIQNGKITITVNGVVMGTTQTFPSGCFQFNNWNDSKLADQLNKSRSLGNDSTELNFQTQYSGDNNHNPVNASAGSYLSFYAVPLAPAQYDASLSPSSEINVTQGSFAEFHVTVKPLSKYWEVLHMKLGLQRTPCGLTYDISHAENNGDLVLENHPGSFNVTLATASYTPAGRYWIAITQDTSGLDNPNIDANVDAFFLNVMRK